MHNYKEQKVTTRFPMSYRCSAYVTPKGGSKINFVIFANKNQFKSNKLCYKVSLCENFQQQSCSRTIPLSNGVYMFAVNVTLEPNIQPQIDPPPSTMTLSTYQCISRNSQQKVKLSRIRSRLRAFQRAIDEVRTLRLTPPKGNSCLLYTSPSPRD